MYGLRGTGNWTQVNRRMGRSMREWREWLFGTHFPEVDNKADSALVRRKQNSPHLRTLHMSPSPLLKATRFPTIFLIKASFPCFLIRAKLGTVYAQLDGNFCPPVIGSPGP